MSVKQMENDVLNVIKRDAFKLTRTELLSFNLEGFLDEITQEIEDLLAKIVWGYEIKKMRKEKGRIVINELMERLHKYPFIKEIGEQVKKESDEELYEYVRQGKMSSLSYYRTIKHMSQTELAKKVGTTQSAVARAEGLSYAKKMKIGTAKKYAKALGISPKDLMPIK